ncbi:alpha/beta hydrolase fold domain-containing protein [Mycobacterium sp. AMU20-3851]|uniref:alpha/beta hydrolase fold domain-containing protein n=1 Tax=Mycobacterium sp. AMU20-3851 TaxID=3122055 RepID=UPI003754DCA4
MGVEKYVGRVGALAVALGVGAAVAGWGAGVAHADEGGPAATDSAPSSAESAESSAPDDTSPAPQKPAETANPDASEPDAAEDEPAAKPPKGRTVKRADRPRRGHQRATDDERVTVPTEKAESTDPEPAQPKPGQTPAAAEPEPDPVPVPGTAAPQPRSAEPEVDATAGPSARVEKASAGSSLGPDAGPSKHLPGAGPQLWTLAAFARRDLEPRSSTTAEVSQVQTSSAVPAVAPGTVTYTAGPTLFDRIAVAALRVIREVSRFIGVNLYGQLGKAMASSNPPFFAKFGLEVKRTEFEVAPGESWKVWEFVPPEPSGKTVIAVHGGGFILEPIALHWLDYADMARRTGATVVVPIYPLATTERGAAVNIVPAMADFIAARIATDGAENVSIYADSAGPNLALGAIRDLVLRGDELPSAMVLVSFTPDLSLSNPDAFAIDDPILDLDNLEFYADENHWGDGLDPRDPMISPLFLEDEVLQALPPTTVYVGSLEFVLPDTLLFHERANAAGASVSTVVGVGQYHDWPIGGLPINSQAPKVRKAIFRQLGLIA